MMASDNKNDFISILWTFGNRPKCLKLFIQRKHININENTKNVTNTYAIFCKLKQKDDTVKLFCKTSAYSSVQKCQTFFSEMQSLSTHCRGQK